MKDFITGTLEEFENGCNTDNISDPPSNKDWLKSFLTIKLTEAIAQERKEFENSLDVLFKKHQAELDEQRKEFKKTLERLIEDILGRVEWNLKIKKIIKTYGTN